MMLRDELRDLQRYFLPWLIAFVVSLFVVCLFGIVTTKFYGITIPVLTKSSPSITTQFFLKMEHDLLPVGVDLISVSPITVFLLQLKIAMFLSFVLVSPLFLYALMKYLSPALLVRERIRVIVVVITSSLLFFLGVLFAYKFLIYQMFQVLFSFNRDLRIAPLLAVDEFMSWALASLLLTGLLFLLPLFMYLLSLLKITSSRFWASRWREVFLVFLIISSIITPDVSGVSVIVLSVPMILLYSLGIILAAVHERKRRRRA